MHTDILYITHLVLIRPLQNVLQKTFPAKYSNIKYLCSDAQCCINSSNPCLLTDNVFPRKYQIPLREQNNFLLYIVVLRLY